MGIMCLLMLSDADFTERPILGELRACHCVDAYSAVNNLLCWQVYRQADDEWQLEKSDSLAVLQSHRAAMEAVLADVKYDKIAHVRQVSIYL